MIRALPIAALLACCLSPTPTQAQAPDDEALTLVQGLSGDVDERAAVVSMDLQKWRDARSQAEKVLAARPDSFIATFVLGVVHAEAEGNLARARFLVKKARDMVERAHGVPPQTAGERNWHKRILFRESVIAGQMDRRAEQLRIFDVMDAHYVPKQTVRRIWPLLKLGRFDEARAIGAQLIHDENQDIRERAYNGLMAVEEEAGNRKPSYEWGQRALEAMGRDSCILATNTALGARRAFDFPNTLTYDQRALKAADNSCPTSPHAQLTAMHLVHGQFQQSLSALKALRRVPRPADLRVQNEMVIRARFVELLLALGQFEDAEMRVREILAAPDRAGMISAASEIVELSNALLGYSVLTARYHQLLERASARPLFESISTRLEAEKVAASRWRAAREATRLAALPETLLKHVRPYYTDVMPWYGADMLAVFGGGVMQKAVDEARAVETDYPEEAGAFLDAYLAELAWRRGDLKDAIEQAEDVLKRLPAEPRLFRARITAWLASARWATGDHARARTDFARVLDFHPTALRHLDLALPVTLEVGAGALAAEVGERLQGSPRLQIEAGAPFAVTVDGDESRMDLCLQGVKRVCARVEGTDLEGADDPAAAAIDVFHDEVFSPSIELTQSDINSLDGRAVRQSARDALDGLLGPRKDDDR